MSAAALLNSRRFTSASSSTPPDGECRCAAARGADTARAKRRICSGLSSASQLSRSAARCPRTGRDSVARSHFRTVATDHPICSANCSWVIRSAASRSARTSTLVQTSTIMRHPLSVPTCRKRIDSPHRCPRDGNPGHSSSPPSRLSIESPVGQHITKPGWCGRALRAGAAHRLTYATLVLGHAGISSRPETGCGLDAVGTVRRLSDRRGRCRELSLPRTIFRHAGAPQSRHTASGLPVDEGGCDRIELPVLKTAQHCCAPVSSAAEVGNA